jgi:hypothetical protein
MGYGVSRGRRGSLSDGQDWVGEAFSRSRHCSVFRARCWILMWGFCSWIEGGFEVWWCPMTCVGDRDGSERVAVMVQVHGGYWRVSWLLGRRRGLCFTRDWLTFCSKLLVWGLEVGDVRARVLVLVEFQGFG